MVQNLLEGDLLVPLSKQRSVVSKRGDYSYLSTFCQTGREPFGSVLTPFRLATRCVCVCVTVCACACARACVYVHKLCLLHRTGGRSVVSN